MEPTDFVILYLKFVFRVTLFIYIVDSECGTLNDVLNYMNKRITEIGLWLLCHPNVWLQYFFSLNHFPRTLSAFMKLIKNRLFDTFYSQRQKNENFKQLPRVTRIGITINMFLELCFGNETAIADLKLHIFDFFKPFWPCQINQNQDSFILNYFCIDNLYSVNTP